jgi:hypothetical protein
MDAKEKLITEYAERYAGHPMDKYHDARLYAEAYKHFEAGLNATPSPTGDRYEKYEHMKCETGCKKFSGHETRHHPDCVFYVGSFSEMYDKLLASTDDRDFEELKKEVERLKGLIKKAWFGNGMDCECESCTADFNKFKTENNL